MNCPRCQRENAADAAFCEECGVRLEAVCHACAATNRLTAKFCRACGHPMPHVGPSPPAAPQSYTPRHLVERILTSRAAMEGERKEVTVLFADIKGSMELIADRDPEDARKILDPVIELMMDAVHQYEGTVCQLMGDGIMALFGAPLAHEDHAARACHAAMKLQVAIEQYAKNLRAQQGTDIQVRVGMNSGEVVVRSIHSDLRVDYSAVGQTAHLAARLEQLARPGAILISASTLLSVEGLVDVRPLGMIPIKGLADPVPIYELIAARHAHTRFHRAASAGDLSRFVGREMQLAAMQEALGRAHRGHGQIVALMGEPGVGKSRIAHEFARSCSRDGWITLEAHAVAYGTRTAYLPLVSLLKTYCGLSENDGIQQVREKVAAKLESLDQDLSAIVPPILWLLGVSERESDWNALDPSVRHRRTLDALSRFFLRQSQIQPLLLVFEDLHWVDEETESLLNTLVEMLPTARILLVVTYRNEYDHRWTVRAHYTQIRVDPLSADSAAGLLDSLIGCDATLDPLKRILIERTEGNPFFLEESVRALVDGKALLGERGAYRLSSPLDSVEIPSSVRAVLAARIDRLLPADKELLEAAAVIGRDVAVAVLRLVAETNPDDLRRRLQRLQDAEFLYRTRDQPAEYTFKHSLTHDVAYAGLLRDNRKRLHAAATHAIETLYPERLAEHVETLARHATSGEIWDSAVKYLRQAGTAAALRSAYRESSTWHRSAIDALKHLPMDSCSMALGIDIRFELYSALLARGDHVPIFEVLEETERLGQALGDERRLARTYGYLAMALWWTAEYARAIEVGDRAVALARKEERRGLEAIALVALGWTHYARGEFGSASDVLKRVLELASANPARFGTRRGAPLLTVMALSWLASCDAEQGNFDSGLRYAHEAVRGAEEADHPWSRAAAYHGLGTALTRQANLQDAIPILERGLRVCENFEVQSWRTTLSWDLGYAYSLGGDTAHGIALLEQGVSQAAADGSLSNHSLRLGWLAEAELLAGHTRRASELGEEALALARARQERPAEGHVLRILGDIAAANDPTLQRSLALYETALTIGNALAMRPLQAQCHASMGRLLAKHNDPARAAPELGTAAAMFGAMKMAALDRDARRAVGTTQ